MECRWKIRKMDERLTNPPMKMKRYKLLLIGLLIVGCEEILDADITAPTVVITYPVNGAVLSQTETVKVDVADIGIFIIFRNVLRKIRSGNNGQNL